MNLLNQHKSVEAETLLRECVAIREKVQPDEWTTFNARSLLGGSLLAQKKYSQAEPLIISGYDGIKARLSKVPDVAKTRLAEAADRVVQLFDAWGKKARATEWRAKLRPTNPVEQLAFAQVAYDKKRFAEAANLWAEALKTDTRLGDDLMASRRYRAACAAALTVAGQGEDAAGLDDNERTRLRKQTLDWLRSDLALRSKQIESGQPASRAEAKKELAHWQQDPDLAGIRDEAALAKLPVAEREEWHALWGEVRALIMRGQ